MTAPARGRRRRGATLLEILGALAVAVVVIAAAAAGADRMVEARDDHRAVSALEQIAVRLDDVHFGPWPAAGTDLTAAAAAAGATPGPLGRFSLAATVVEAPRVLASAPGGYEVHWDGGQRSGAVAEASMRALSIRLSGVDRSACMRLLTIGTDPRGGRLAEVSVDPAAPAGALAAPSTTASHFHPPVPRPWAPAAAAAPRFPVGPAAAEAACGASNRLEWVFSPRAP